MPEAPAFPRIPASRHQPSRRRFLAGSLAAAVGGPLVLSRARGQASPNNQIAIGTVGYGSIAANNTAGFLAQKDVRVVAVAEIDPTRLEAGKGAVDKAYGNSDCKAFSDFRDLIAMEGLDAVCICLPDHWHARVALEAVDAGLDVYGEKPFTWGLAEGRQLIRALEAKGRVWQTGSWQRSMNNFRRFRAVVQTGILGKITRVECGTPKGMSLKQHIPADQVEALIGKCPGNFDWKAWCGPVGEFPYHPLLHPWNWRWHTTFGGGQLLDWVGHHVDIALWTLGLEDTGPVKVEGTGTRVDHPFFNTLGSYSYAGTYADGRVIEVRSDFMGTRITGENGWIFVDRGKLEASDPAFLAQSNLPEGFDMKPPTHQADFIRAVRTRQPTASPAEGSHRAASFGQLALVAIDTGRPVKWDPVAEKVVDDAEQAAHPRLGSRV